MSLSSFWKNVNLTVKAEFIFHLLKTYYVIISISFYLFID